MEIENKNLKNAAMTILRSRGRMKRFSTVMAWMLFMSVGMVEGANAEDLTFSISITNTACVPTTVNPPSWGPTWSNSDTDILFPVNVDGSIDGTANDTIYLRVLPGLDSCGGSVDPTGTFEVSYVSTDVLEGTGDVRLSNLDCKDSSCPIPSSEGTISFVVDISRNTESGTYTGTISLTWTP